MPPKANPKGRSAKLHKFPERLPEGEVLVDTTKKRWILGPSIGKGGFGEIYSAASYVDGKPKDFPYVIKIEPHENGPLFVEMHFYQRVVKPDEVNAWKKKEKVDCLGIPLFYGSGSHTFENCKYRFIVIDRFGKDLWSIFVDNNKSLPESTVYKCAVQILNVLKFIHEKGYAHGDVKGLNLLLGYKQSAQNHVFLVDYGLACKHSLKEFKPDPKRAGDGTLEYISCDMHVGVPTQRGDLEILGYNLLHWLSGKLPWEGDKNLAVVHGKKKELMLNPRAYLKKHFPKLPEVVLKYFEYVSKLGNDETPDINFCKNLFTNVLKAMSSLDGPLFPRARSPSKTSRTSKKGKAVDDAEPSTKKERVVKRRTKANTQKTTDVASTSNGVASDDDIFEDDQPASKKTKKTGSGDKPVGVKRVPKAKSVVNGTDKPSWRDLPTVSWNLRNAAAKDSENKTKPVKKK